MSRRKSREHAFRLLYQIQINNEETEEQIQRYIEENSLSEAASIYVQKALRHISVHKDEIDQDLSKFLAKNWTIDRIPKVELAIMRLAYYEILNMEDVPKSVAINEAVELAKAYAGDNAEKYINAVLANIQAEGK